MNGMDVKEWDPSTDKFLEVNFNADTVAEGKAAAKATLQQELGLAVRAQAVTHVLYCCLPCHGGLSRAGKLCLASGCRT